MNYDESVFKEKANRKARKIWLIFAILLSANYGSDVANGLRTASYYFVFLLLCWLPILIGEILLRIKGFTTELYRYAIEIDIISHVIAKSNGIDDETMRKLREMCKKEVEYLSGKVSFENAYRVQKK